MANTLAYGFVGLQDVFGQRLNDINTNIIDDAIAQSLAEYNRQVGALVADVVERVTVPRERFLLPGTGTLQPLDEWGNPLPVRTAGYADIGFPIQGGGTAWGTNRVSRASMTVAEANRLQVQVQQQDADWMRRHILAAVLDNTSWTYPDVTIGDVTVYPLANGDTQTYMRNTGLMSTAQHYSAQTAAIADATNPFPTLFNLLSVYPGNNGPYVAYVPTALRAAIENLATFQEVADPNIRLGANANQLGPIPGGIQAFGDEVIGYVAGIWIVTWAAMPANTIFVLATGAGDAALAQREYGPAELSGLFEEDHSPDGNRQERRFIRYTGFSARNRTAGAVHQVSNGDTTYDIPTGYATPLPV